MHTDTITRTAHVCHLRPSCLLCKSQYFLRACLSWQRKWGKEESTSKLRVEKSRSQSTNARMQSPPCLRQTCAVLTKLRLPFDAAYALHMRDDLSGATARVTATVSPIWSELVTEPQLHI